MSLVALLLAVGASAQSPMPFRSDEPPQGAAAAPGAPTAAGGGSRPRAVRRGLL